MAVRGGGGRNGICFQRPGAAPVLCSALQWEFLADEGGGLGDLRNKSGDLGSLLKTAPQKGDMERWLLPVEWVVL